MRIYGMRFPLTNQHQNDVFTCKSEEKLQQLRSVAGVQRSTKLHIVGITLHNRSYVMCSVSLAKLISFKNFSTKQKDFEQSRTLNKAFNSGRKYRPCSVSRCSTCSPQTCACHRTFPLLTHTLVTIQFWGVERDYKINEITLSINIALSFLLP